MRTLAPALRKFAFSLTVLFAAGGILFASGYVIEDPGGWLAVLVIAALVVPLAGLAVMAHRSPDRALSWLLVGIGLLVAYMVAGFFVQLIEAPVVPVATLVLAVPAAVIGLGNARRAAELLLLLAAGPLLTVVVRVLGGGDGEGPPLGAALGGSTGVVVLPLLLFAGLFLVAAAAEGHRPADARPGTPAGSPGRR